MNVYDYYSKFWSIKENKLQVNYLIASLVYLHGVLFTLAYFLKTNFILDQVLYIRREQKSFYETKIVVNGEVFYSYVECEKKLRIAYPIYI